MSRVFHFETKVRPGWIDYNGHMRDSYFGLVFSLAVDALQDEVGFDASYREATGNTIYLLEDHKVYLREVTQGAVVRVETRVLGCDAKRFHLYMQMFDQMFDPGGALASVGEFMELHVAQRPEPRAAAMPVQIQARLQAAIPPAAEVAQLEHRARAIGLRR
ncbi:MAG TPA: 4-hydroxybenzoyl-CoA thioesterase [Rhodobacteraceae bacterium]|nr:4-hydroxybenzoyl-CoA thioesterase [Paracoccaceae bacterium]